MPLPGEWRGRLCLRQRQQGTNLSYDVALGELNGDGNLDAVFANLPPPGNNRRCLGDGAGGFSGCANVSGDTNNSWGVALGLLGLDLTSVAVTVAPANGAAVVNADGTITYTPNPGFSGVDTFTYSVEGSTATVTVNVTAPEIDVLDGGTGVPDGTGSVDLGTTTVGTPVNKTFTIQNTGTPTWS